MEKKLEQFAIIVIVLFIAMVGHFITVTYFPEPITIRKSSDSNFERSTVRMPDTTITTIKVINGGRDTLYPTTQYLNIK